MNESVTITIASPNDPPAGIPSTYWQLENVDLSHLDDSEVEECLRQLGKWFEAWICDVAIVTAEEANNG